MFIALVHKNEQPSGWLSNGTFKSVLLNNLKNINTLPASNRVLPNILKSDILNA